MTSSSVSFWWDFLRIYFIVFFVLYFWLSAMSRVDEFWLFNLNKSSSKALLALFGVLVCTMETALAYEYFTLSSDLLLARVRVYGTEAVVGDWCFSGISDP